MIFLSQAALNAATKSMSIDLKNDGIMATCIHPGWVKTDMGGANAQLDVDTCVTGILKTLRKLEAKDNGAFIRWDGEAMPW